MSILIESNPCQRLYAHKLIYRERATVCALGVAGGDGELGCLCGRAGTGHLCDGSAHSSGCVVNAF